MADLSDFTANMDAVQNGVWISVGTEPSTFRIKTRGVTSEYRDGLNLLRREAAREANRGVAPGGLLVDPDRLPPTLDDRCQGRAIAKYCFLDVEGLTNKGQPVTADEFSAILMNPEGRSMLLGYAIGAAFRVADEKKADKDAAEGNSLPVSASA